jgi:hypothetical protein
MLQTRKGIFRSATNAAIFVSTLFACEASADVVSVIKGLLHVMIHRCQILKADLNLDFRFGPLSRASYASPTLDNNEFATRAEATIRAVVDHTDEPYFIVDFCHEQVATIHEKDIVHNE